MQMLLSFCLPAFLLTAVLGLNITLEATDSSLSFIDGWQSSQDSRSGDLFFLYDDIQDQAAFTAQLPERAVSVSYIGLKRSGGSVYGVCVDTCGDDLSQVTLIDGNDPSLQNDVDALPTSIFTVTLDPTSPHTLLVFNIRDTRFGGQSAITFSSLSIITDILDEETNSVLTSTSPTTTIIITLSLSSMASSAPLTGSASPTSSSNSGLYTMPSMAGNPDVYTSWALSPSPSSSAVSPSPSVGDGGADDEAANSSATQGVSNAIIAVIAILCSLAVISLLIGMLFYTRSRNRNRSNRRSEAPSFGNRLGPTSSLAPQSQGYDMYRPEPPTPSTLGVLGMTESGFSPMQDAGRTVQRSRSVGTPSPSPSSANNGGAWITRTPNRSSQQL